MPLKNTPPIRVLPPEVQNQIAAGEVVERPSSVVKELVENSLDAGATTIKVDIRDGGRGEITVQDNGRGMPAEEVPLALTRHATSKLTSVHDLSSMASFGFRGEALPSIASISSCRITSSWSPTPEREPDEGTFVQVLHGRITDQGPAAPRRGTRVEIRDLFANVPARLKFLKTPATETRRCADIFARMAMAHPGVDFELSRDGRPLHRFLRDQTLLQRVRVLWPPSVCDGLREFSFSRDDLSVHGLAGSPETAQSRGDRIFLYVNGRPVQDKMLLGALRQAYKGRLLSREYPQVVLFLDIPAERVDVNVHPAKTEVRFQDEGEIFSLLHRAVDQAFSRPLHVGDAPDPPGPTAEQGRMEIEVSSTFPETNRNALRDHAWLFAHDPGPGEPVPGPPPERKDTAYGTEPLPAPDSAGHEPTIPLEAPGPDVPSPSGPEAPEPEYLGQLGNTYLIFRTPGQELELLDQHAAHERILYEAFRAQGKNQDRRPLALPMELSLHPAQADRLTELWEELAALGFSLERPSDISLLIRTIPVTLKPAEAREYLEDTLSDQGRTMDELWTMLACRSAIKAGQELTRDEAMGLLSAWQSTESPAHCPHGRPVRVSFSLHQLEKMFKRKP